MKAIKTILAAVIISFFFACSGGMSGTYKGKTAFVEMELKFTSSNNVQITAMGQTTEGTYEKSGEEITINANGKNQVFKLDKEGCLDGGLFKLCKENQ